MKAQDVIESKRGLMCDPELQARASMSASRHRRELERLRRQRRFRLRSLFAVPAVAGATIAVIEVMQPNPPDAITLGAAMLTVPFLATFDLLGGRR